MIPTMAVKITEKTYPIAAACLAARFATLPLKIVLGNYLVINGLSERRINNEKDLLLVVGNSWMTEDHFVARYEFVDLDADDLFNEVRQL